MFVFHVTINNALSEGQMGELRNEIEGLKSDVAAEKVQSDAREAKVVALEERIVELERSNEDDPVLVAELREIRAGVRGIVADEPTDEEPTEDIPTETVE